MLKINFKKYIKKYFNIFLSKNYFKKQSITHTHTVIKCKTYLFTKLTCSIEYDEDAWSKDGAWSRIWIQKACSGFQNGQNGYAVH